MRYKFPLLAFLFLFTINLKAQTPVTEDAAHIKLDLEKLNTVGSVLYIAAHPDDENTKLLAYLANERKVRTGYLSLTRGDGGQNLIGNEQAELLGVIRTQELLAARRTDGAEQFFTRANDFGFSKSAEETFTIWDKEKILSDVVWVIRKFQPDIIITRFPEDARAGHGQHWASAILAHEAFLAAADPKRFPEQLKYVQPWKTKRLLWNTYNFGGNNTTSKEQLKIDIGMFNPLLGKSYGEIAAESRSNHKSQGFGSAKSRGKQLEYFKTIEGPAPVNDLFDGVDLTWNRLQNTHAISNLIRETIQKFDMDTPEKSVKNLLAILKGINQLDAPYWKLQKLQETKNLIANCSGLWFESDASDAAYGLGDSIQINNQYILNYPLKAKLVSTTIQGKVENVDQDMEPDRLLQSRAAAQAKQITEPYWLESDHPLGNYVVKDQQLIGYPENPDPLSVNFNFLIENVPVTFSRTVIYKSTDPVQGEVYQPVVIAPPVTATINEKALVFTPDQSKKIIVNLKAFTEKANATLQISAPKGWKIEPDNIPLNFNHKFEEQNIVVTVTPDENAGQGLLKLQVKNGDKTYQRGLKVIQYAHIPKQTLFPEAEAKLINLDIKTDGKRIGYLAGAGDLIPESLKQIGYLVEMLSENTVLNTDLSKYDAIITGVRTYNINPHANIIQPVLLNYVKNGGTLLVQYNVNSPLQLTNIGPYPFTITRSRVTDENAEVNFTDPEAAVLNYPNKITQEDFKGWVQERGLYYLSDIDNHYAKVLSMKDPGEAENEGSLIVTDYGKGKFVYTSLAFFRQLPAGVPGAYRLFVNLIAKNKE